jgi:hypothetical protein
MDVLMDGIGFSVDYYNQYDTFDEFIKDGSLQNAFTDFSERIDMLQVVFKQIKGGGLNPSPLPKNEEEIIIHKHGISEDSDAK